MRTIWQIAVRQSDEYFSVRGTVVTARLEDMAGRDVWLDGSLGIKYRRLSTVSPFALMQAKGNSIILDSRSVAMMMLSMMLSPVRPDDCRQADQWN